MIVHNVRRIGEMWVSFLSKLAKINFYGHFHNSLQTFKSCTHMPLSKCGLGIIRPICTLYEIENNQLIRNEKKNSNFGIVNYVYNGKLNKNQFPFINV